MAGALILLLGRFCVAQQPVTEAPPPPPTDKAYVLHVYQNLMQIPTLILKPRTTMIGSGNKNYMPVANLTSKDLNITLDGGPSFHPTKTRIEGNDSISLAIVLDRTAELDFYLPTLQKSLRELLGRSLMPHDHVSIYTVDCSLERLANDVPASNPQVMEAVNAALPPARSPGQRRMGPCRSGLRLWDNLATVAQSLAEVPGWRAMLVLSNGDDRKSTVRWRDLLHYAAAHSVTVFGVVPTPIQGSTNHYDTENGFNGLCQSSGGWMIFSNDTQLADTLTSVADDLRGRYILEFARPNNEMGGWHQIEVTLTARGESAYIRPAGISVPLADPALLADPNTVPSAPSPAQLGTRKMMNGKKP